MTVLDEMAELLKEIMANAEKHTDPEIKSDLSDICAMSTAYLEELALDGVIESAKEALLVGVPKDDVFQSGKEQLLSKFPDAITYGIYFNRLRDALNMESST